MLDRLKELELSSKQLEPDKSQRKELWQSIEGYAENFLSKINTLKAYDYTQDKGIGIYDQPISEQPRNIESILQNLAYNVDRPGLNPASHGHLGYIPGGGIYTSALGDYLSDITNRYAGVFFASPGAVRMENMLIDWMGKAIGYKDGFAGNLSSGGSISNLIAISTARHAMGIKPKHYEKSVIYMSEHTHHCINKSLSITGLSEGIVRFISLDEKFRMNADELERTIAKDKEAGLRPWLVIASAGTTDMGAVDPIERIAVITKENKLWLHVDGAYGGLFTLCEEGKKILKGLSEADSIVIDPHKTLFLPYGLGTVLVKDKKHLIAANRYRANYMQDIVKSEDELSPADLSPELSKPFRGLRLWLPLMIHGAKPFRDGMEEKILLARYFYEEVQKIAGIEVGPYPDLSVAAFRYVPKEDNADEFNQKLVDEIQRDGRVFLSSTKINDKFTLRIAVLSFRTHLRTIDLTLDILKEKILQLERSE